jgi:integrase
VRVSDLAEALLRDYKINRRKSLHTVKSRWETHLKPFFGELEVVEITTDEIEAYIAQRLDQKAENSTINRELAALKRMYSLAIRSGKLSARPYIPVLKEMNVRKGFLRDTQYHALARETGAIGLWLRAVFECGCTYGCRKSELLNLKVRQVSLEERAITLDPDQTKNDEARLLPMDRESKVLELIGQCVAGKGPEDYVFTRVLDRRGWKARKGGHISDMREAWAEATKAAGCPDLLFHDLRRSGVRNLIRSGVSEKTAMIISGHRTRSVFERYNIIDRSDLDKAMEKLEEFRRKQRQLDLFESGELFPGQQPKIKPN